MKVWAIATATITDASWTESYTRRVTELVERHGGRYLVRTSDVEVVEPVDQESPHVLVILEFPSRAGFFHFYHSADYQPFLEARRSGSLGQFYLVNSP